MKPQSRPNYASRRQFCAVSLAALSSLRLDAATWSQWRGPFRNGNVDGATRWPDSLSGDHLKEVWSKALQPSYSGPVVAGDQVIVTETVDKARERVQSLSVANGQPTWASDWAGSMQVPFFANANGSWIRSTPAIADERVFVAGMRDMLVCLNASTGEELWRNDFVQSQKSALPAFGFVCSPLVHGEFVYVQAGGGLLKVAAETGQVVWSALKDGGGMNGSAFSSPVVATIGGVEQLVVQTRTELAGVSIDDGRKLWSVAVPAFRGMNILPPTVVGDSVFTSSYGGGSFLFQVSSTAGAAFSAKQVWANRVQGYMSSPQVHDGHVYVHLKNGRLTCMELATGKQTWSSRPFGKYWSSVAQEDRMLSLDERGELLLVRLRPDQFELLDRKSVASNSWAHLAVVEDLIMVRDIAALKVFQWT